jgi:HK97 family phage major capsid protein
MNYQQLQAIRQLLTDRRSNATMMHNAGMAASASPHTMNAMLQEEEALFEKLIRNGAQSLSNSERIDIAKRVSNAMSTTTGSQGGFATPATVGVAIADALNQYSSVRRMATVLVTMKGENSTYPSTDGRDEVGEQMDQNAAAGSQDIDFGTASLNTFKYGSKLITVPIELVQDSSIDIIALLERRIAARIGRITNTKFTIGAGTTEPMGVATAAGVGKTGANGQTTTVTDDDLEDLMGSVDPAYRESAQCGWMMNDATLRKIAKLKDSAGQPLNLVKYGSRAAGTSTTLKGFPVETNPDMPVMAANAKSILFGDFSRYVVRDVASMAILRMEDSAFVNKGQVGFLGIARAGGAYVDLGNAIMAYKNSAS